jgi:hypothetical protein
VFQISDAEQPLFEAAIYNRNVRALVKDNRSHPFFDDKWADVMIFEVSGLDEAEVRAKLARRYPPELGFVLEVVVPARLAVAA